MKLFIKPLSFRNILGYSYGNILNSGTVNVNTLKPEHGGLFCTRIFGPIIDYTCDCGFFKKYNSGIGKCSKCGVEYISSASRRNRMAYIDLIIPLSHFCYLNKFPYVYSLLLELNNSIVVDIINYKKCILFTYNSGKLLISKIISFNTYYQCISKYGNQFLMMVGSEAIYFYLKSIDLNKEIISSLLFLKRKLGLSYDIYKFIFRRLKLLILLNINNIKPFWFMIRYLPILPPDLRPLIIIDNKKVVSSGINKIYSNIIDSNNRLKKLLNLNAPILILINAKSNLQLMLDKLFIFDDSNLLLSNFKGKYGLLRNNLLGKRVDFSARTVIVVEPNIPIYYCGVPYLIFFELLKPILVYYIIKIGYACNITNAISFLNNSLNKLLMINLLRLLINKYPVILNRAPTLHRMNIQSFLPYLVNDKALHINPLVCKSFNADFDGDQMAIHIPLYSITKNEVFRYLISYVNLFSPSNSRLIYSPSQESMLGLYYLTYSNNINFSLIRYFYDINYVYFYYLNGANITEIIFLRIYEFCFIKTTIGRVLIFKIIKFRSLFIKYNKIFTKTLFEALVDDLFNLLNKDFLKLSILINKINILGIKYSLLCSYTFSVSDFNCNEYINNVYNKFSFQYQLIRKFFIKKKINNSYKKFKLEIIFNNFLSKVNFLFKIRNFYFLNKFGFIENNYLNLFGSIIFSGAKNILSQFIQLTLVRGIILTNLRFNKIFLISSSLYGGLSMFYYFISSYGSRKGLCDTSINTSLSGYFTRKLISISRDLVINNYNCNSRGIKIFLYLGNNYFSILGRFLSKNIYNKFGSILYKRFTLIKFSVLKVLLKNVNYIFIRTPSKCLSLNGVCVLCYGLDLSTRKYVGIGTSVGVIASQSIGEPGTQLTMRTFHTGGFLSLYNNLLYFKQAFGFIIFNISILGHYYDNKFYIKTDGYVVLYSLSGFIFSVIKIYKDYVISLYNNNYYFKIFIYKFRHYRYLFFSNLLFIYLKYFLLIKNKFLKKKWYLNRFNFNNKPFILIKLSNLIRLIRILSFSLIKILNKKIILKNPNYNIISSEDNLFLLDKLFEVSDCYFLNNNFNNYNYLGILLKSNVKLDTYYNITFLSVFGPTNFIGCNNNFKFKFYLKRLNILNNIYINYLNLFNNNIYNNKFYGKNILLSLFKFFGLDLYLNFFIKTIIRIFILNGILVDSKHIEVIFKKITELVCLCVYINGKNFYFIKNRRFLNRLVLFKRSGYYTNISKFFLYNNFSYRNLLIGISKISTFLRSFISSAASRETLSILFKSSSYCMIDLLESVVGKLVFGQLPLLGTGIFLKNVYY